MKLKTPPNAGDYGLAEMGGCICFMLCGRPIRLANLSPLEHRQYCACMQVGWLKEAERIRDTDKYKIKSEVDCDARSFHSYKVWPKADAAEKQAAGWAKRGEGK
jgi:hypothetical protein